MSQPQQPAPRSVELLAAPTPGFVVPNDEQDATLVARGAAGKIEAACSLWWTDVPALPGQTVGVIGHYSAVEDGPAGRLLEAACEHLAAHGCTIAIGPMDGNTWRKYRFVTEAGEEPPFFLEPENPASYPSQWHRAGFEPLAHYFSSITADLEKEDARVPAALARLRRNGIAIREIAMSQYEAELSKLHEMSLEAFRNNFLYTDLSEAEFLRAYLPLQSLVEPRMILIAEHGAKIAGFVMAIPDLRQARAGRPVDTMILKTVAAATGRTYAGLGAVLVQDIHCRARALGYRRVIHALMYEGNNSLNLSGHYGTPFRRYTLYGRSLA